MTDTPSSSPLMDKLGKAFQKGRDEVVRQAKVGRLALDMRTLKADRDAILAALGAIVAKAQRAGEVSLEGADSLIQRLDAIEERIDALATEREDVDGGLAQSNDSVQDAPSSGSE